MFGQRRKTNLLIALIAKAMLKNLPETLITFYFDKFEAAEQKKIFQTHISENH